MRTSTKNFIQKLTITESTYIVIVTRGHRDDMRVLRWAVTTPAKYIAMIGSKRKVIAVIRELEKEGIRLRRVRPHLCADGIRDRGRIS